MARSGMGHIRSLAKVVEDAHPDLLRPFLNATLGGSVVLSEFFPEAETEEADDGDFIWRKELTEKFARLHRDITAPVEEESRRILEMAEGKGPTSLHMVAEQELTGDVNEALDNQPGDLGRSLWLHFHHRKVFDDAVSFRRARIWRDGKLYSALEVPTDRNASLTDIEVHREALLQRVQIRLGVSKKCGFSVIELPSSQSHPPSLLVIIRIPYPLASVAEHPDDGSRRMHYFHPQEEIVLIYTPTEQKIEVCGQTAKERAIAAESFAQIVLGHDTAAKPLTWANYDLSRFFRSFDLDVPVAIPGFDVIGASVTEVELRLSDWTRRLRLLVAATDDISAVANQYFDLRRVMRKALGIARLVIAVSYRREGAREPALLSITMSDRNRCDITSQRDPEMRQFGRLLLQHWSILQAFRDLADDEAQELLPLLIDIFDTGNSELRSTFFEERGHTPARLIEAGIIKLKGADPIDMFEEFDADGDVPAQGGRSIFRVQKEWLRSKIIGSLHAILDSPLDVQLGGDLARVGTTVIDGRDVPCFLARGLSDQSQLADTDLRLRGLSGLNPGIVFAARSAGLRHLGANVLLSLAENTIVRGSEPSFSRAQVEEVYRTNLGAMFGGSEVSLLSDGQSGTLVVPGKPRLQLFSERHVIFFQALVDAHKQGLPGVHAKALIENSGSQGVQQMIGLRYWKAFEPYLHRPEPKWWSLKTN